MLGQRAAGIAASPRSRTRRTDAGTVAPAGTSSCPRSVPCWNRGSVTPANGRAPYKHSHAATQNENLIAASIDVFARKLLGGHVRRRAEERAGHGHRTVTGIGEPLRTDADERETPLEY